LAKISRRVLKYRERQRRGAVMRPSTFAAIERRAAAGGAYDPAAVAGAAYWKTLAAKYRGNPSKNIRQLEQAFQDASDRLGAIRREKRAIMGQSFVQDPAYIEAEKETDKTFAALDLARRLRNPDLEKTGGLHIKYSPVNAAYFLMWHDTVLRIFPTKAEAKAEMDYLLRQSKQNPRGRTVPEILRECDEVRAALRHRMRPGENPDESFSTTSGRKLVGEHKGVEMYFEGISYNAPALKLYGYSTELALMRAINRKLKKRGGNPFDWREQRQHTGGEGGILDSIRHGDKVTILSPQGQERTGKAVMRGPHGWVLNMGGAHGTPGIATESNIVKVRKANPSRGVFVFFDDSIGKYTAVTYHPRFGNLFMTGKTEAAARRALRARVAQAERTGTHRNPDDELPEAERLYETFHGREPREILELTDSAVERGEYVNLGDLVELTIVAPDRNHVKVGFKDDGVRLASTAEGTQLVLIGGNQDISRTLGMFGAEDTTKDLLDLGDLKQIVYDAAKWQTDFTPQEWKHDLGEESGIRPRVLFNQLKKRIFFAGGTYRVERPGIVD
jgi:hypothetical protein